MKKELIKLLTMLASGCTAHPADEMVFKKPSKKAGMKGFVFCFSETKYQHALDSDRVKFLENCKFELKDCEIPKILIQCGITTYTLNQSEARIKDFIKRIKRNFPVDTKGELRWKYENESEWNLVL